MNRISELLATVPADALLPSTIENIQRFGTAEGQPAWALASVEELLEGKEWTELNDRFYRNLAFGTGGIRGRTIGKVTTKAERGTPQALDRPEHAAVGSNMLNTANVVRAAQGLGLYLKRFYPDNKELKAVIVHDTRHFSKDFTQQVAEAFAGLGITPYIYPDERSTPQLSWTVRWLKAHAGVVITASHNPPHDNGFKAYFTDGAQLVEPHASGVIDEVNKLHEHPLETSQEAPAPIKTLGPDADEAYIKAVSELVIEPEVIAKAKDTLKLVYTPLHGTGIKIIPQLLKKFGFTFSLVEKQTIPDGRFPTVKSPNPENAEALQLGIDQANAEKADIVLATDPDDDRMGVAVRNAQGEMVLLTGNMIGSILAHYRTERFFAKGLLNDANKSRASLVKTFVTTDLQKSIATHFGVKCINTLTGFKYIGEKMHDWELQSGLENYDAQTLDARRKAQLEKGTFFIFGGEESYGYSGADYVRDKDANAAVLMFAEVAAWASSQGQTLVDYLDAIYQKFGYYTEKLGTLTFEGAAGAEKIQRLLASYRAQPPATFMTQEVTEVEDFGQHEFRDADGKIIPRETMLIFHLAGGSRMAVRGSGTEPKIKFYFFAKASGEGDLAKTKLESKGFLDSWWNEVQADVEKRVGGA